MRFIHLADVHLGAVPDRGCPWSDKRENEIWETFRRVIAGIRENPVDLLFIAGDLFHRQPLLRELKEVNYLFSTIPETRIYLMAGNHDYIKADSFYRDFQWEKNVTFFKNEQLTCVKDEKLDVYVYGLSYEHQEIEASLYDGAQPQEGDGLHILLAHGGDAKHIPFSPAKIIENGFDYIAAGHIHRSGWLMPHKAVMAGSLEPTDCNDTGPHGYWMGTLGAAGADVYFYPLRHCEYCHEMYQADRNTTDRMLWDWAKELLEQRPEYQYFRLYIKGKKEPEYSFDVQEIGKLDRIVDITDQTVPDYDYGKLLEEHADSILGEYIRSMRKKEPGVCTAKALE